MKKLIFSSVLIFLMSFAIVAEQQPTHQEASNGQIHACLDAELNQTCRLENNKNSVFKEIASVSPEMLVSSPMSNRHSDDNANIVASLRHPTSNNVGLIAAVILLLLIRFTSDKQS